MYCSICTNPQKVKIVEDYIYSGSLRIIAARYNVGYRSIQRHINFCIASIQEEKEEREYQVELNEVFALLRLHFYSKQIKPRLKSIIKKQVAFTWSRRAWKSSKIIEKG